MEPPSFGRSFTWTNGQVNPIWVKFDRFLVNNHWITSHLKVVQRSLLRLGFDHVPIQLEMGNHISKPRQFRFELVWCTEEGFTDLINNWWNEITLEGCVTFVFSKKLAYLRDKLRSSAKSCFGSIKLRKLGLLNQLDWFDVVRDTNFLSSDENSSELVLKQELDGIYHQEELNWRQRSRTQWLKEGDEKSKFFHVVANGRKNKNFIPIISHDGRSVEDGKEIGKIFSEVFQAQFGSKREFKFRFNWTHLFSDKSPIDLTTLERPFIVDEIKDELLI